MSEGKGQDEDRHPVQARFQRGSDLVSKLGDGKPLPSESASSAQLGVSRTTVRAFCRRWLREGS